MSLPPPGKPWRLIRACSTRTEVAREIFEAPSAADAADKLCDVGSRAAPQPNELADTACRQRLTEQISLHLVASGGLQEPLLHGRFDPLRSGLHLEAGGQAQNGVHDGHGLVAVEQVSDKRAVDLDAVEWKASEIGKRRIAGTEIVQRDAHAEFAKLVQHQKRGTHCFA